VRPKNVTFGVRRMGLWYRADGVAFAAQNHFLARLAPIQHEVVTK
jgi:hypothetical protein